MRLSAAIVGAILVVPPCAAAARPAAALVQPADPAVLAAQARRLQVAGKLDEALARYERALRQDPTLFEAQLGIGIALDLLGRYGEARTHFAKAIETAPEGARSQALEEMAVSYAFEGNARSAAKYFQQEYDRQTANGNLQGASETANALGRVYLESGDPKEAYTWYETGYETARRQPKLPASELDLAELRWAHARARIAARRGRAAEARAQEAAVKALVDKGDNPEQAVQLPYLAGYVDFYLKDYRGAVGELAGADQKDPFIQVLLAQAYEKTGDRARARQAYERVLASTAHSINNAFARPIAKKKAAG